MKKTMIAMALLTAFAIDTAAQQLYMPRNVQNAFNKGTRSMDGKPGKNYWQNKAQYAIAIQVAPPSKLVTGSEKIVYSNNSPDTLKNPFIKLILNIHQPGAARQSPARKGYLTEGITIDSIKENGVLVKLPPKTPNTMTRFALKKPLAPNSQTNLEIAWHYELSEESGREGKLDSTSFFLAYFYPRIAVFDDIDGWDTMQFTDAQEFYNDFNDYDLKVTVPANFLVWATGELQNANEVLNPAFAAKLKTAMSSDQVVNIATKADNDAKAVTPQKTNTWHFTSSHITDVAMGISDHYNWDASSTTVDKAKPRRVLLQAAYLDEAVNFKESVEHSRHAINYLSNVWPGVPYHFPASTVVQGFADMEYPMMANDSHQDNPIIQRFVAEHEIAHSWFPFRMGINEHRYGCMDEGWTTAFEYMIGTEDLGKEQADEFFKSFRVNNWALGSSDENQIPIITPTNILSGSAMGNNEYGKAALAYLALKDLLGDEQFRKCLHGFIDRWQGKHPIPWDMFNSFSNIAGKDLNWFWNNWFFTNNYPDLTLTAVTKTKTGYSIKINNTGGFAIPTNIVLQYADKSSETLHQTPAIWQTNQKQVTINLITKKKLSFVGLETGIFVDGNQFDNFWGTMPK